MLMGQPTMTLRKKYNVCNKKELKELRDKQAQQPTKNIKKQVGKTRVNRGYWRREIGKLLCRDASSKLVRGEVISSHQYVFIHWLKMDRLRAVRRKQDGRRRGFAAFRQIDNMCVCFALNLVKYLSWLTQRVTKNLIYSLAR